MSKNMYSLNAPTSVTGNEPGISTEWLNILAAKATHFLGQKIECSNSTIILMCLHEI